MTAVNIETLTSANLAAKLPAKGAGFDRDTAAKVMRIIDDVAERGDAALLSYTEEFDRVKLAPDQLRVSIDERDTALAAVEPEVIEALESAAERIRRFHQRQLSESWMIEESGSRIGQRLTPIARVGLYVPGGRANYPSTVLMNVIPAQIAGVRELVVCCPPDRTGSLSKYTLAAAAITGVEEIYRVGGAQAVAALAYGTETIKPVDKITGPGNVWVAAAKRLVFGRVDIDMIAGPTEVLIIADRTAPPRFIAADMIAQAEHDPLSSAILLTEDRRLAEDVNRELAAQMRQSKRAEIVAGSLAERGRIYLVDGPETAIEFANGLAPEHLEIMTADAEVYAERIKNAGAIFLGNYAPEAVGDYIAGPNHVLPTGSTARFCSPLGVYDFVKWSSVLSFSREGLAKIGEQAAILADVEQLDGHARSVRLRLEDGGTAGD